MICSLRVRESFGTKFRVSDTKIAQVKEIRRIFFKKIEKAKKNGTYDEKEIEPYDDNLSPDEKAWLLIFKPDVAKEILPLFFRHYISRRPTLVTNKYTWSNKCLINIYVKDKDDLIRELKLNFPDIITLSPAWIRDVGTKTRISHSNESILKGKIFLIESLMKGFDWNNEMFISNIIKLSGYCGLPVQTTNLLHERLNPKIVIVCCKARQFNHSRITNTVVFDRNDSSSKPNDVIALIKEKDEEIFDLNAQICVGRE